MFFTVNGTKSHRRQNTQEAFAAFTTRAFPDSFDVSEMKKKTLALALVLIPSAGALMLPSSAFFYCLPLVPICLHWVWVSPLGA